MENFGKLYSEANENIVPSPDFTERTMDRIFGEQKITRFPARKTLILIAAAILLLALGACTAAVIHYISNKTPLSYNQYYSSASDHYASNLNLYAESGGVEIVLTDAVFENDILTMSFDYEIDGYDYLCSLTFFGELKIDGRKVLTQGSGMCYNDETKTWFVMEFDLSSHHLTGVHQFDLTTDSVYVRFSSDSPEQVTYDGQWSYSFTLDTSILSEDTVVYSIDRYVTLYDGSEIYLDCIICTPMTQRLVYRTPPVGAEGFLPICDVYAESSDGKCNFRFNHNIAGNAESINITPDEFDLSAESITLNVRITGDEGVNLCDPFRLVVFRKSE